METEVSSILAFLDRSGENSVAICDPDSGTVLSYLQLKQEIEGQASLLTAAGVRKGDAVVLASANSAGLVAAILAVIKCGAVAVPINPDSTADEISYCMNDSEAVLMIAAEELAAGETSAQAAGRVQRFRSWALATIGKSGVLKVNRLLKRDRQAEFAHDICLMIYTSGTTSKPKGVPLTHANLLAAVESFAECFRLTAEDATIVPMPLFHVHGLIGATLSTLWTGGTAVLQPRFSASRFWAQVKEHKVTWYTSSPTIHRILLKRAAGEDIPRGQLRFIRSSSASLGDTLAQMEEQFGAVVLEGYGMTEAANQVSCNPLPPRLGKPGSVGVAAGVEVRILDGRGKPANVSERGEIAIRGQSVLSGYHNKPQANAESFSDGWFRTGDEGYLDEEGYLFIVGRIKELINRGGEKISPAEVEAVLLRHPLVEEAGCFAVADAKYGEEVHAAVVSRHKPESDDIIEFCRQHLSAMKVPKKIYIVEKIPRTATNKVQRQQLARLCSEAASSSGET